MTASGFMWVAGPGYRPNGADDKRREGDPVPEAFNWPRVDVWEKQGHIKKAFDSTQDPPNPDASSPALGAGAGDGEEPVGTSPDAPPLSTPAGGDDGLEQEAPPPLAPPPPPVQPKAVRVSIEELEAILQEEEDVPIDILPGRETVEHAVTGDALMQALEQAPFEAPQTEPAAKTKRKRKTTKRKPRKKAKAKATRAKRGARAKE